MNDIYIDANIQHSFNKSDDNSEFTYKLSEPLELPKGTQINIAQSFINKKGITGGSIEIDEDIYETLEYVFYITEQGHFQSIGDLINKKDVVNTFARPTLRIGAQSFFSNFDVEDWGNANGARENNTWIDDSNKILYGEHFFDGFADATASDKTPIGDGMRNVKYGIGDAWWDLNNNRRGASNFRAYGGNNMVLPQVRYDIGVDDKYYLKPVIRTMDIFIPRGVYGIGELGQLVEDYFNGMVKVKTINGVHQIDRKSDIEDKMNTTPSAQTRFNGQPLNNPTTAYCYMRQDRQFSYARGETSEVVAPAKKYQRGVPNLSQPTANAVNGIVGDPVYKSTNVGMEGFTSMDAFNELLQYTHTNGLPDRVANNNQFEWINLKDKIQFQTQTTLGTWIEGRPSENGCMMADKFIDFAEQAKRRPFYYFTTPEDEGVINYPNVAIGDDNKEEADGYDADPTMSLYGYNKYGESSNPIGGNRNLDNDHIFRTIIGTTNFTFSYNTEKNGFEMKGLHQQMIAPSHGIDDVTNPLAGKQIINFKKLMRHSLRETPDAKVASSTTIGYGVPPLDANNNGYFANKSKREKLYNQLNTPETRLGGMMIINWAKETSNNNRTANPTVIGNLDTDIGKRFDQYFNTEAEARANWKKTLWYLLGFEYDQIANRDNFKQQNIYNKDFRNKTYFNTPNANVDCGFTTDTDIDNSIISSISGLSNPINVLKQEENKQTKTPAIPAFNNVQMYGMAPIASPFDYMGKSLGGQIATSGQYSNSMYICCSTIPVAVADVGGIVAKNLPTLTKQSYYLITSDVLDNYKDNVKQGEPLALLGVVAKSNLSNQDFIVDKNEIVQTISQTKVVNKIKIKILNPDLTSPLLEDASSIMLKITRPNITPTDLLLPKQMKSIAQETATL